MPTDYGSDVSTYQDINSGIADLNPNFTVIRGPRVVVERVARKLITPTGSMLKAGWGYDLRAVLQASLTSAQIGQLRGIIADQIREEPEVSDASVDIDYTLQLKRLAITAIITLIGGEIFPLVFVLTPGNVQVVVGDMTTEAP